MISIVHNLILTKKIKFKLIFNLITKKLCYYFFNLMKTYLMHYIIYIY